MYRLKAVYSSGPDSTTFCKKKFEGIGVRGTSYKVVFLINLQSFFKIDALLWPWRYKKCPKSGQNPGCTPLSIGLFDWWRRGATIKIGMAVPSLAYLISMQVSCWSAPTKYG